MSIGPLDPASGKPWPPITPAKPAPQGIGKHGIAAPVPKPKAQT